MSSANNNFDNVYAQQPPPEHHQHRTSDVLPGARGADQDTVDYSADVTNDSRVWQTNNERRFGAGTDTGAVMAGGQHSTTETGIPSTTDSGLDRAADDSDRPMNVQPTSAGESIVQVCRFASILSIFVQVELLSTVRMTCLKVTQR